MRFLHLFSNAIAFIVTFAFWLNYKSFNSPRFEIDTNYLRWSSRLPAFSVCQANEFSRTRVQTSDVEFRQFIHGLIRPGKKVCAACSELTVNKNETLLLDFNALIIQSLASCQQLFHQCSWNNKKFDCCQRFKLLRTKHGICYSVNSQMTEKYGDHLSVSHFAKEARLTFKVKHPIQINIIQDSVTSIVQWTK